MEIENLRLKAGVWEGIICSSEEPGQIDLRVGLNVLGQAKISSLADGKWSLRVEIPAEAINPGAVSLILEDAETGAILALETMLVGAASEAEFRSELEYLRAEMELLKRVVRGRA